MPFPLPPPSPSDRGTALRESAGAPAGTGVTPLSPHVEALLRVTAESARPTLPGDAKAHLLAAYERRGGAPASGLRLLLGGVRWSAAALSAAAAAVLVVFSGSLLPDAGAALSTSGAGSIGVGSIGTADLPSARGGAPARARIERPIAWERVHPLPSKATSVRVVDDQSLPLIGVGWTPELDGP